MHSGSRLAKLPLSEITPLILNYLDSFYIEIPLLFFFLNSLKKYNEITFKFELGSFYIEIPLQFFL